MEVAYKTFQEMTKGSGNLPASGKTWFRWKKHTFNHMSLTTDSGSFLVYKKIVVSTFPRKFPREKLYDFLDRNWDVITHFMKYIDEREEEDEETEII